MLGRAGRVAAAAAVSLAIGLAPAAAGADPAARDGEVPVFDPSPLSEPRFPVATTPLELTLEHDGAALAARAWLPDTTSEPTWRMPVVLVQSPYGSLYREVGGTETTLVPLLTPRGYAVVVADAPGTGRSGGCYDLLGPSETGAAAAWVAHLAAQPWSSGAVGMVGFSADGEAAASTATRAPAALRTAVTFEASTGVYEGYAHLDGVPFTVRPHPLSPPLPSGAYTGGAYAALSTAGTTPHDPRCPAEVAARLADPDGTRILWFVERDGRERLSGLQVPLLTWTSTDDPVVLPTGLVGWLDRLPRGSKAVVSKDPGHSEPWAAAEAYRREDARDMLVAWLDEHLLGLPTRTGEWPRVQLQDEDGAWRTAESFEGSWEPASLHLRPDGVLAPAPERGTTELTERTGATFTTNALKTQLHLGGAPFLDVRLVLDRPDAHLMAVLQEVAPDGTVSDLTTGALSVPHGVGSLERPRPAPRTPVDLRVRLVPLETTVAAGSRLRLVLGGVHERGIPAGTAWTAAAELGPRSRLVLPVVTRACGLVVRSTVPPRTPPAAC